ncbi:hypothetical protein ACX80Q_09590 [Arthrobacter sp. HLT1-20]
MAGRISAPIGDSHDVVVDLDFTTARAAEDFLARPHNEVWNSAAASPTLASGPTTRILDQLSTRGTTR